MPGLHGMDEELDWHCGSPALRARPDIVYLYSVEGSEGSRTTYVNSIESYNDLSDEWKERINDLRLIPTRGGDKYSAMFKTFGLGAVAVPATDYFPNVVHTNRAGKKCIYLPIFQMAGFVGFEDRKEEESEIYQYLKNHMLSEKYQYHHDWDDGDIIMWDNWTGLHKRWAFAQMSTRTLHRMEWNFVNKK
jgi:alpha-ketoglutarate-dependent taurine dioxygenase